MGGLAVGADLAHASPVAARSGREKGAPGITVAYVDRQLRVIDIHTMKPNHIGKARWHACHALDTVQRTPGIPSRVIGRAG